MKTQSFLILWLITLPVWAATTLDQAWQAYEQAGADYYAAQQASHDAQQRGKMGRGAPQCLILL